MHDADNTPDLDLLLVLMQRMRKNADLYPLLVDKNFGHIRVGKALDYLLTKKYVVKHDNIMQFTKKGSDYFNKLCKQNNLKGINRFLALNTDILRKPVEITAPYLPLRFKKG